MSSLPIQTGEHIYQCLNHSIRVKSNHICTETIEKDPNFEIILRGY